MKTKSFLFFIFYLLTLQSIYAEIFKTKKFKSILNFVTPKTLVLLDIDDTLLIPVQTLGTDAWFCDQYEKLLALGAPKEEALDKSLALWEAIRHLTKVKIVEPGSAEIVALLQKSGISVMGLTTQGLALATRTVNQLKELKIDLSINPPSQKNIYFMNGSEHGVLYRQGIFFTSGTRKGVGLLKLLEAMEIQPERVLFINDKLTHLKDVEGSLLEKGIPFIGLRYSYSDERVISYRPEIAEIQFNYSSFAHILSDEEAEKVLSINQDSN